MAMKRIGARGLAGAMALVVLISVQFAAQAPLASAAGAPLYPNIKTLPPRALVLDRTDVSADSTGVMHNVLRFSNTPWNAGEGRFEIRATINPTTQSGPASQRVYDNAGGFTDYPVGSIYYHAVHGHYHFEGWGRYELWPKAAYDAWIASGRTQGAPQWSSPKTTSCILDEEAVAAITGTPAVSQYPWTGCNLASDNTLTMGQSPGWGDTYDYFRFEQWIDLNQDVLADGPYVLRSVTDAANVLYESSGKSDPARETDNEATTLFTMKTGALQDSDAPTGTVWVNGVDTQTSNSVVNVSILGRDDVSGVDTVRLSNDGTTWSAPQAYTGHDSIVQNISWDMADARYGGTAAAGPHTVYVQFHDKSGKWSASITDTLSLISCAPSSSSSGYASAVTADAPVSYWRLGESCGNQAADARGANPGTYVNGVALAQPSLLPADGANTAAGFDGVNDNVQIANSASLNLASAFSLEAWIKPTAIPAAGGWASVVTKPESYSLQFNGPRLEFCVIQGGTRRRLQAPAGAIAAGLTYHVTGTYDGTMQRLYVNGTEVASAALTGAASATTNPLRLGSWDGTGEYYKGVVDDVAVYNKALTAAQVANHNTAGRTNAPTKPADPTNLVATASGSSAVALKWTDNANNETGMVLERSPSSTFASVTTKTFAPDVTTYTDTGLVASTTYYYRVKATNGAGDSAYSNTASVTTGATPPLPSAYAAAVLADGPVSYWRLGEASGSVAADQRAANAGAYGNGALLAQPSLLPADTANTSVAFDGVNDQVSVAQSSSLNLTSAFSLETWIKPTAIPAAGGWASVVTKPEAYSLQFNGPRLEFTIMQSGTRRRLQAPAGAVVAGAAYHVVATYDGTTQRLYLNGAQVANAALTGAATTNNNPLRFASWDGAGEFFKGVIDDVAVYNRTLSAAQVANHDTKGRTG
ncbi:MAG: hypothetical protein QOC92_2398 [Acidimicrobiaceae bacterium]